MTKTNRTFLSNEELSILNALAYRKSIQNNWWCHFVNFDKMCPNDELVCHICDNKFVFCKIQEHGKQHIHECNLKIFI